MNKIVLQHFI